MLRNRERLPGDKDAYSLKTNNLTRWNSWYDAAERALDVRFAIDDFTDQTCHDYDAAVDRARRRAAGGTPVLPKAPTIAVDRLSNDDWHVIATYVELLKPLKDATMNLQGNVHTSAKDNKGVKGALWQVLPAFEEILQAFEHARDQHNPQFQSQPQFTSTPLPASPPRPVRSPQPRISTRSSKRRRQATPPAITETCASNTDSVTASPAARAEVVLDPDQPNELESHFSTNINRAWQKLDKYYNKSDITPIHRAAVLLHPRMKWRWFDRYWKHKTEWITDAKAAIKELWEEYKTRPVNGAIPAAAGIVVIDEWTNTEQQVLPKDQLKQYEAEGYATDISAFDSPIPYWINKRRQWPQLAQMALDIYSTPAMSDEPERQFSIAGNILNPRRRTLKHDTVQALLCLRSWQQSGIIQLDQRLCRQAVIAEDNLTSGGGGGDGDGDSDNDEQWERLSDFSDEDLYH